MYRCVGKKDFRIQLGISNIALSVGNQERNGYQTRKMANPQKEDGHVDLANEIVEALAKIRISGEEMQCLWVIFRKTYGWHKKEDSISLSQFCQTTNLKKPRICHALQKLLSKKVIIIAKNDNGITNYGFNKDFDSWMPLPKKVTLPKMAKGGAKKGNESLPLLGHTKETIQKKTIQKKKTLSGTRKFLLFYKEKFEEHFEIEPLIDWGKDSRITSDLLKTISLDELKSLLEDFFLSEDKFIRQTGYTIGVFKTQINKLKIGTPSSHVGLKAWANEIKEEEENGRKG